MREGKTASETAKGYGIKSLVRVSEITGINTVTLNNWHRNRPKLFRVILLGCNVIEGRL